MKAKISFYLERKQLKSSHLSIYCYLRGIAKGKTLVLNTSIKTEKENWDAEEQIVLPADKEHRTKNAQLESFKIKVKEQVSLYRLLTKDSKSLDYDNFVLFMKEQILGIKPVEVKKEEPITEEKTERDFFETYQEFKLYKKGIGVAEETQRKYRIIEAVLRDFQEVRQKKISFDEISESFMLEFSNYLFEQRKLINNTVNKYLEQVRTFLNYCIKEKACIVNPNFKLHKVYGENIKVIALNFEEIDQVRKLDLQDKPHLSRIRDVFIFMILTGQRYADYVNFEKTQVENGVWSFQQQKTEEYVEVPLPQEALRILEKYQNFHDKKALPIISNQKMNLALKEICRLAGITQGVTIYRKTLQERIAYTKPKYQLVSCHTTRRTFITNSLRFNLDASLVRAISGHKGLKDFQKYVDVALEDKKKVAEKWNNQGNLNLLQFKQAE